MRTAQHSTTEKSAPLTEILIIFKIEEEYWKAEANKLNCTDRERTPQNPLAHSLAGLTHSQTHSHSVAINGGQARKSPSN